MKIFFLSLLMLLVANFGYAYSHELYSDKLLNAIKSHLLKDAKFYIDEVQDSGGYYFASVVEYHDGKFSAPHLFVFDENFSVLKNIVIEDFCHFKGLILEDIDKDGVSDVVVMTSTGANSNQVDVFLNKLREKGELIKIFTQPGNYTLRFYVALGVPTIEISGWTGTLNHPLSVFKWNGKKFVYSSELSTTAKSLRSNH